MTKKSEEEKDYEGENEDGEREEVKTESKAPFIYCSVCESEYSDGSTCDRENCPW